MEQGENAAQSAERRAPVLRPDLHYRRLAANHVFLHHPSVAGQILDERAVAALQCCRGQSMSELLPEVRQAMDYDCTEAELQEFLDRAATWGVFAGIPRTSPRVRLFDPDPALGLLTQKCRWLFTPRAVAVLFLLLALGVAELLWAWPRFVGEVTRACAEFPVLSILLFYFCFMPVGLLHELAHGLVARWFGGDVVEVGLRKDTANLYVLTNMAPLRSARRRMLYFAGGAFLDMFIFFALVNVWLLWPNYITLMFLLPQALFVLQFSYAMEEGSDLSKIVSEWTKVGESRGRWAFLKEFFVRDRARVADPERRVRAAIYLATIALQTVAFGWLLWSFRHPATVRVQDGGGWTLWGEIAFLPPLLYLAYRILRYTFMNWRTMLHLPAAKPAPAAAQ
jgi:hypothetical protein